jgi:hypothetical protein
MIRMIAYIVALIGSVIGFKTGYFYPLTDWIKEFVVVDVPAFIWPLLPQGLADYIKNYDIAAVSNLMQDVTWFIPFWEVLLIYFTAFAFAGAILLVRYIVGWIPTIEG